MCAAVQRPLSVATVGLAAVLCGPALAQPDSAEAVALDASAPTTSTEAPEEVTVRGRKSLTQYRVELEQAREEIVEIFNKENSSDDTDLVCRNERPTGTRMPQRICRSVAQERADAGAAKGLLDSLWLSAGQFKGPAGSPPPAGGTQVNAAIGTSDAQRDAAMKGLAGAAQVEEELERLKKENRQLYRAVVKYLELQEEYNRARGTSPE